MATCTSCGRSSSQAYLSNGLCVICQDQPKGARGDASPPSNHRIVVSEHSSDESPKREAVMGKPSGMRRVLRYRFNEIGWIGAALFIGSPAISAAMIASSVPKYLELSLSGAPFWAEKELYHPALYWVLMVAGLVGFVMLLVGRQIEE